MTAPETTLARLAVEYWKLLRLVERVIATAPDGTRERIASQARYAAGQLETLLDEQNMSLQVFDGMRFEVNLPASPINGDEVADAATSMVERTLEPAVICDMRVVLPGKVFLAAKGVNMYLGIDLGTSNSAIAGNDGRELRVFKTTDGYDVLPSALMIDRRGAMFVGKRAYDQDAFSPENVGKRFKRLMGTNSPITFKGANRSMSPEEASSEVLKALLAQAQMDAQMGADAFEMEGAIVTIPAAFNQMQSEATMRAAGLSGISNVGLLQEPIAAAMASLAERRRADAALADGQFLVYDLGGGTFDAAIVQSVGGTVNIVGHAGVNMLGGTDFDRNLVNTLVRPWLLETFDLPEDM